MNKINKIMFADDHPGFIQNLVSTLGKMEDIEIVGIAHDGTKALQIIREYNPDIAFLDIEMPELDGFLVARTVIGEGLNTKIVFLTMFNESSFIRKGFELGIKGYILKESAMVDLPKCIVALNDGGIFVSPLISGFLAVTETKFNKSGRK